MMSAEDDAEDGELALYGNGRGAGGTDTHHARLPVAVLAACVLSVLLPDPGPAPTPAPGPPGGPGGPRPSVRCLDRPVSAVARRAAATRIATTALQRLPASIDPVPDGEFVDRVPSGESQWRTVPYTAWTSGFTPALAWIAYGLTGSAAWRERAVQRSRQLPRAAATDSHDVGFMVGLPASLGLALTGAQRWRTNLKVADASLQRHWVRGARVFWSLPADDARVIVDSLANLQLVWSARAAGVARRGDAGRARTHARTVMGVLQRPDGSTFHVVDLDRGSGAVRARIKGQGYAVTSTWTRGQAWSLLGLTQAWAATGDRRLLAGARRAAQWWIEHLPADCIPWSDADGPMTARDTSAAAVAAAGLTQLASSDPDRRRAARWSRASANQLIALASPRWMSAGGPSLLDHGAGWWSPVSGVYTPVYGDYYALETAARLLRARPFGGAVPLPGR